MYKELHMNMVHLGADRTLQLIRKRFYWPGMEEEVRYFISNLCTCVRQKKPHVQVEAPLLPIITSSPLEVVGVDFLHLEKSSGGFEYILLLTDHFTRYTQAYPTKNKAAKTAVNHLYNDFILRFGYHPKYCTIREESLRMALSRTLQIYLEYKTYAPPRITLKQMVSQKE